MNICARFLILLLALGTLSSFKANYVKLVHRVNASFTKEFGKDKHLHLIGSGGAMMDDVKGVTLHFISYEPYTIEEARSLYIELVENYLCRINQTEKLRPYLHDYPFTNANLNFIISFEDNSKHLRSDGYVAALYQVKDHELVYSGYDDGLYPIHRETYDEAKEIVLGH